MAHAATAAAAAGLAAAAALFGHGPASAARLVSDAGVRTPALSAAVDWSSAATDSLAVPDAVRHAAASLEIAVVDTGADVTAPAIAAKAPATFNVLTHTTDVTDVNGHGTMVASIAAGAGDPALGLGGAGGDARLLIVKAADASGIVTTTAEANAIRYAVKHGARIINLSFAGETTSSAERAAIRFATQHGVLDVAAAGNGYLDGNPVEYPAALLQPVGSNGRGGTGLVVGASARDGTRAPFSAAGSWVSLAAPGEHVVGALSHLATTTAFPRIATAAGAGYAYGSGTSFAAPQVAGAAALVWAADPELTAREVADILRQTASGHGTWTPDLGYGVVDVGAAVALAQAEAVASYPSPYAESGPSA